MFEMQSKISKIEDEHLEITTKRRTFNLKGLLAVSPWVLAYFKYCFYDFIVVRNEYDT